MGISGRSILKDYTLDDFKEAIFESYGRVKEVAVRMHCSQRAIYEIIDIYPELQSARTQASNFLDERKVETANEVLDKLLQNVDADANNAFKAANLVLTKSKKSRYYDEIKNNEPSQIDSIREIVQVIKNS